MFSPIYSAQQKLAFPTSIPPLQKKAEGSNSKGSTLKQMELSIMMKSPIQYLQLNLTSSSVMSLWQVNEVRIKNTKKYALHCKKASVGFTFWTVFSFTFSGWVCALISAMRVFDWQVTASIRYSYRPNTIFCHLWCITALINASRC